MLFSGTLIAPISARAINSDTPAEPSSVHFSWAADTSDYATNLDYLDTNITFDEAANTASGGEIRQNTFWLWAAATNHSSGRGVYGENGPMALRVFAMRNAPTTYTSPLTEDEQAAYDAGTSLSEYLNTDLDLIPERHYGLPYRNITRAGTNNVFKSVAENLTIELRKTANGGSFSPLDTSGYEAVNLALNYIYHPSQTSLSVAFLKRLQVYVSLDDGSTWLGPVGIRSTKLIAGGRYTSHNTQCQVFHIETESLLNISGVAGNTITDIRIMPDGEYAMAFGDFSMSELAVNCYDTMAEFQEAVPADEPEYILLGEDTMRAIVVQEAINTASTEWKSDTNVTTSAPAGSSGEATNTVNFTYGSGITYRGLVYNRNIDSTRELHQSAIVDGVYGFNGAGYDANTSYGMDCQTFVYNAISRVSRTYAWSVKNTFGNSRVKLLGNLETADHAARTDADIVDLNTPQAMYEAYAQAQAGDIVLTFRTNNVGSVHTRVVRGVSVVRTESGDIDPEKSIMSCTEQKSTAMYEYTDANGNPQTAGYTNVNSLLNTGVSKKDIQVGYSSRTNDTYTFSTLLNTYYVPFTLTDYDSGMVEAADVEMVVAPKAAGRSFADGGIHISIASNYRLIGYGVSLEDASGNVLFDHEALMKNSYTIGLNYDSATLYNGKKLDDVMGCLPNGEYKLVVRVTSGPATELPAEGEQTVIPVTTKEIPFTVEGRTPCSGSHEGWTDLAGVYNAGGSKTLSSGKYYLSEDLVLEDNSRFWISSGAKVTFCLNGHTLTGKNTTSSTRYLWTNNGGTLNICDCCGGGTITHSTTSANGTATIYLNAEKSKLNLYGGTISGNTTARYGTVFLYNGSTFNMMGGSISGNRGIGGYGSGVYVSSGCTFNLWDGTISNNEPTVSGGGGVYVYSNGTFNMMGGSISNNTLTANQGGGVYLSGGTETNANPATFHMSGGVISGNSAPYGGGVYVGTDVKFTMTGGTIVNNHATATTDSTGGGGIYSDGQFNMAGGIITGNTSATNGGGVKSIVAFQMTGGTIGGSALLPNSTTEYWTDENGQTLTGNTSTTNGGGVYNYGSFDQLGGRIEGNTATKYGGGVYSDNFFRALNGAVIANNTAQRGGGVYISNSGGTDQAALYTCYIVGNHATNGGGIYVGARTDSSHPNDGLQIHKAVITGNTSSSTGAGLYNSGDTVMYGGQIGGSVVNPQTDANWLDKNGNVITGNRASNSGGGVRNEYNFTLRGGIITGNATGSSSSHHGGGISNSKNLTVYGGEISGNTATAGRGGGVYHYNGGSFTLSGGTVSGNTVGGNMGTDVCVWGHANNTTFTVTGGYLGSANPDPASVWVYTNTATDLGTITLSGGTTIGGVGASGKGTSKTIVTGNAKVDHLYASGTGDVDLYGGSFDTTYSTKAEAWIMLEDFVFASRPHDSQFPYELIKTKVYNTNISLGEDQSMSFLAEKGTGWQRYVGTAPTLAAVVPTKATISWNDETVTVDVTEVTVGDTVYYCATLDATQAAQVTGQITVQMLDDDDHVLTQPMTFST